MPPIGYFSHRFKYAIVSALARANGVHGMRLQLERNCVGQHGLPGACRPNAIPKVYCVGQAGLFCTSVSKNTRTTPLELTSIWLMWAFVAVLPAIAGAPRRSSTPLTNKIWFIIYPLFLLPCTAAGRRREFQRGGPWPLRSRM